MSGASHRTSYTGPAHSVTRSPVSSSTSRVSPSMRLSPSSITPPGGVQSWLPLRRRFCTRSTPSSLRMSAPPTTQSRTCPSSRDIEAMHPNAQRVAEAARGLGLELDLHVFPEGTRTAEDAARAIGVEVGQIVKSLVFTLDGALVMALVAGKNRLDERRLAATLGGIDVGRADAAGVRAATGYA